MGAGATGARTARQLVSDGVRVLVSDQRAGHLATVVESLGPAAEAFAGAPEDADAEVAVLCLGPGHAPIAARCIRRGIAVVSVADDPDDVRALLDLDAEASERGTPVVAGAGFSPGLTCLLAAHAASTFDRVDEIHVARTGTGGPACAEAHHRALAGEAFDWRDGGWVHRSAGSGRELCWFPDPIGGRDCYRAGLAEPLLLVRAFPDAERITARMGATRRDRLTAGLPMLRKPHPEGTIGAVRVELRGRRGTARDIAILGAMDRPGVAAGCVAAVAATFAFEGAVLRPGAGGLAELVEPVPFLAELARRGVRAAVFDGIPA